MLLLLSILDLPEPQSAEFAVARQIRFLGYLSVLPKSGSHLLNKNKHKHKNLNNKGKDRGIPSVR